MNLFFSGGTGFFGRAALRYLMSLENARPSGAPDLVTVLSRDPDTFLRSYPEFSRVPWLRFHRGDIEVPSSLPTDREFTHVLHAAADSTDAARLDPLQKYDQIVQGTRNMLEFAAAQRASRFLLTSSGGAYGSQPAELRAFPESYCGMPEPLSASNAYGVAKRHAEHLCALYGERCGTEIIVARCFAFVGEDLPIDAHFAIGNFIRDALFNEEITVRGDGTPVRTYMDQSELARWLLVMLDRGVAGRAYNVGSDEELTIAELAVLVRDTLSPGKPVRVQAQPKGDQPGRNRYVPDVSRARTELGLRNEVPLPLAIQRAASGIAAIRAKGDGIPL